MNTRVQNIIYERERRWFFAALACLLVLTMSYMYFLSASVLHVVMRKEVDREIATLSSKVGNLEALYIEAQHRLSEDMASLHGFTRTSEKVFIDRSRDTLTLSSQ